MPKLGMDRDPNRRRGRTTQQMILAPEGSIYIWCNKHLDYPKQLARDLGRPDLRIVSPNWVSTDRWVGMEYPALIVDHAIISHFQFADWKRFSYHLELARLRIRGDADRC